MVKQVLLEQLTSSPWNNFLFMSYYGLVVEGTVAFSLPFEIYHFGFSLVIYDLELRSYVLQCFYREAMEASEAKTWARLLNNPVNSMEGKIKESLFFFCSITKLKKYTHTNVTLLMSFSNFKILIYETLYVNSSGQLWDGLIISMFLCNSVSCSAASLPLAGKSFNPFYVILLFNVSCKWFFGNILILRILFRSIFLNLKARSAVIKNA